MRNVLKLAAAGVLLTGCSGGNSRVVGTWTGKLEAPQKASGLVGAVTDFAGALMGPVTFEFNREGRYKASISLGSDTGNYVVHGDEVVLTPDNPKNHGEQFVLSGDTLESRKEFSSDPAITLRRTSTAEP